MAIWPTCQKELQLSGIIFSRVKVPHSVYEFLPAFFFTLVQCIHDTDDLAPAAAGCDVHENTPQPLKGFNQSFAVRLHLM